MIINNKVNCLTPHTRCESVCVLCVPHFVGSVEANHIFVILMSCVHSFTSFCSGGFFQSTPVVHDVLPQHTETFHICATGAAFSLLLLFLFVSKQAQYLFKNITAVLLLLYLFDLHCVM